MPESLCRGATGVNHHVTIHPVKARGQHGSWTWSGSLWTSPGCSCQLIPFWEGKKEGRRQEGRSGEQEGNWQVWMGREWGAGSSLQLIVTLGRSVLEIPGPTLLCLLHLSPSLLPSGKSYAAVGAFCNGFSRRKAKSVHVCTCVHHLHVWISHRLLWTGVNRVSYLTESST